MTIDSGRVTGSREPDPSSTGSGPSGFDPARWAGSRFARLLTDLQADGGDLSLRAIRCIDDLADTIEGLAIQFGVQTSYNKSAAVGTMGLSDLEGAFDILGWNDPHRVPNATCDEPCCWLWVQCGTPTPRGYRRTCSKHAPRHAIAMEARQGGDGRLHPKDDSAGRQASPGTGEGTDHG